jgi:hypothetical protein
VLTPCVRGTAAFKRTPSGQPEGFASETALLRPLTQSSHSPLLPRESVTLASSPADHWQWCRRRLQAHSVALQNKASAMRRGVTQLAPRLMSVMRTEAGLLGRSMATVRAARRSFLELPTQGALRLLAAAVAQL